jgi:hypothetical protein
VKIPQGGPEYKIVIVFNATSMGTEMASAIGVTNQIVQLAYQSTMTLHSDA